MYLSGINHSSDTASLCRSDGADDIPLRQIVGVKPRDPNRGLKVNVCRKWQLHLWKTMKNLLMRNKSPPDARYSNWWCSIWLRSTTAAIGCSTAAAAKRSGPFGTTRYPWFRTGATTTATSPTRGTCGICGINTRVHNSGAWDACVAASEGLGLQGEPFIDPFWGRILWWNRGDAGSLELSGNVFFQNI